MRRNNIDRVIIEADRFLRAIEALQESQPDTQEPVRWYDGGKETGAVRRASMDLTRALSELRKYRQG